jgi:tetratricopeptide (TPR) repeat protein
MGAPDSQARQSLAHAVAALRAGNAGRAIAICQRHLALDPTSVPHMQLLGRALFTQGRADEALRQLDRAIATAPGVAALYADRGNIQGQQHHYDAAIESFRTALQLDPRLTQVHKRLAQILVATGRTAEADEAFAGYLAHDEDAALVAAGVEHWRAERTAEAEAVLRTALQKNPQNVNAMRVLALVLDEAGKNTAEAETLLRRATGIAPDFHQAWMNLGSILANSGKWTDAAAACRQLVGLTPGDATAWAALGRALAGAGHADEAATAFRRSIEHQPDLAESYWSLARLTASRFSAAEIATMERQLERTDLEESARVNFCFALGKACEDEQDYDRAWQHYQRGNEVQRTRVDYDPVENEQYMQRTRAVFTRERMAQHAHCGHAARDPIFIVGLPRSGAALVERILASHSAVETRSGLPDLAGIAMRTGEPRSDSRVYPETVATLRDEDLAACGREYLQHVARYRSRGKRFFVDNTPDNFVHVGWIKLILPDAKILNIRRHPLDACLAAYRQLFASGQHFSYDLLEIAESYRSYSELMAHWHAVLPGQVLEVHYEEIVTDPGTQARRILEFCGLELEEPCLHFHQTGSPPNAPGSDRPAQPLTREAIGRWKKYRKYLPEWEQDLADILQALPATVTRTAG